MGTEDEDKLEGAEKFKFPEEKDGLESKPGDDNGLHSSETEPEVDPLYPVEYEYLERAFECMEENPKMSALTALKEFYRDSDFEDFFDRLPSLLRKLPEGHYLRRGFAELDDKEGGEPIYPQEYEILERALALKKHSYVEGSFTAPLEKFIPSNDPGFLDRLPSLLRKLPEGHYLRRFFQGYLNEQDMGRRNIKPFKIP